jgi:uncharacterized zinc-type alcohol dehydrogenase-like protein
MQSTPAYGAQSPSSGLAPLTIERRDLRADDVGIEILYCGVCHTDVHFVHDDWGMTEYPIVPGHEIIGRVTNVGGQVSAFTPGDIVGVGCMVDSCRGCDACEQGLEQYCREGPVLTYNGHDRHDGATTYGGYCAAIVVSERFVVRVPDSLDPAAAAPLLCAGITTYSPLRYYGVQAGHRVGVVGMGGLGHMGIKFARALGAEVTVFTRSAAKADEARRQGAHQVVVSSDESEMQVMAGHLDFVLDTVPVQHDLNPYLAALRYNGVHMLVGLLDPIEPPVVGGALVMQRKMLAGSLIGGMPETQEVLDFCAENGISCDVEMLDIDDINSAYERVQRGDVLYRFVIDMATLAS